MSENLQNNKLVSYGLIGLGVLFLVTQIFSINWIGLIWPFFIILPGLPFLYGAINGSKKEAGLIFPGLIITGTGLLLLYQSFTGHWESWAYVWSLYPVMVGLGLQFNGDRTGDTNEVKAGKAMVSYGLMAFVAMALVFEVFIFGSIFSGLTGLLITVGLIGGGVYLLNKQSKGHPQQYTEKPKNDLGEKLKNKYEPSPDINPELRRKIEEALSEKDHQNGI